MMHFEGERSMLKTFSKGAIALALLLSWEPAFAQEKADLAAVLRKLNDIEKRIDDMDKRYEIRFTKIEEEFKRVDERFNSLEAKMDIKLEAMRGRIDAVNQRIDDKFNLIVGLLGIIAAFLALPYLPKILEKYKVQKDRKEDVSHLQEQIDQIKSQLSRLAEQRR
jgi:DNA repair ATPase RecN